MRVLAGDVGGTNTRLAICEVRDGQVMRIAHDVRPSDPERTFKQIVRDFLSEHDSEVSSACFGLPGPVQGRRVHLTNLPWVIDADELERDLGLHSVTIINDLVANAYGLSTLSEADFKVIRAGEVDPHGNVGIIAAGTGLGEAGMHRIGGSFLAFGTEGGHTDFSPIDDLEYDLLRFLQGRHGRHVSWERVLSGPGLTAIYEFLRDDRHMEEPTWLSEELAASPDPSAVIGRTAATGRCELTSRALDLFVQFYGAEAGNLALKVLATGGIYLGGGIAPKLQDAFADSQFLARFDGKGRLRSLLERIPVRIVLNDKAAMQGSASYAARAALAR